MGLFSPSQLPAPALFADHSPSTNPRNLSDPGRFRSSNPHPLPCRRRGAATCHQWPRASPSKEPPLHIPNSRKCCFDAAAALSMMPAVGALAAVALICSGFGSPVGAAVVSSELPNEYACEDLARYYSGAENSEGFDLMEKLGSIVSGQKSLKYKEVWDALKYLDAVNVDDPEASTEVTEIYSLKSVSKKLAGKPDGWNNVNVNSSRGNKYYGECSSESSTCSQPANIEAAPDTETDKKKWAPPLQVRGDVARSVMYMAVRYGLYHPGGSPHLRLSNSPNARKYEMGLLSALLRWNELDPPSREERLRNDRVCKIYQHNRNPFVDHPEYANLIWMESGSVGQSEHNH